MIIWVSKYITLRQESLQFSQIYKDNFASEMDEKINKSINITCE